MARKVLYGTVVSDKMTNTVVVRVERQTVHPLYKKRLTVTKKYSVDSREVPVAVGDFVKIEETVPMSKTKHFKVVEKIAEDVVLKILAEDTVVDKSDDTDQKTEVSSVEAKSMVEEKEVKKPVKKVKAKTTKGATKK
ncbi:MAG TPA: 30S ribosomal protein S17 [Candidatus Levybacteria bacterium]|nr:30S ribosomal protein S17 [Candidatus Levybacteria bacterium]